MNLNAPKRRRIHHDDPSVDRISQLPEPLLHHILSILPLKDATQTSCLSKTWNAAWNSSPILEFDQSKFEQGRRHFKQGYKVRVKEFCDHVDNSIKHRSESNIPIQKFHLYFNVKGPRDRVPLSYIHKWLDYAASNALDQLVVHCYYRPHSSDTVKGLWPFVLPDSLLSIKSLKELDLFGCEILASNTTHLSLNLKKLRLTYVYIHQQTLQGMFSRCRLLEQVSMSNCHGFSAVKLVGLKLEKADLSLTQYQRRQIIQVESPTIEEITYGPGLYSENVQRSIAGCNCKNLKRVILQNVSFELEFIGYIRSKFPAVEELELRGCIMDPKLSVNGRVKIKELEEAVNSYKTKAHLIGMLISLGCTVKTLTFPFQYFKVSTTTPAGATITL